MVVGYMKVRLGSVVAAEQYNLSVCFLDFM
jgi:hypothetical protein